MQYWFTIQNKTVAGLMPEYPWVWALKPTVLQCFRELQESFGQGILFKTLAGLPTKPVIPRAEQHDYLLDLRYSTKYNCYVAQDLVYPGYQVRASDAEEAVIKFFQGCTILPFPQG